MRETSLCIAANFTAEPLEDSLEFWAHHFGVPMRIAFAPYNQIVQQLLDTKSVFHGRPDRINVLLVHLEDWLGGGRLHTEGMARADASLDALCAALGSFTRATTTPLVLGFCPRSPAARADAALAQALDEAERRLSAEAASSATRVLASASTLDRYPVADYYDPIGHETGHVPYTPEGYAAIGTSLFRVLFNLTRTPFKVIALDCDHTLWAGACGEAGSSGVRITEPHRALQAFMLGQLHAGMLLCLCSKNNEDDVLDVFRQRPDMPLAIDHFIARRINWQSKSMNLASLARELDVPLDSFIFVDDNPIECAEVKAHCPEVLTLQLPGREESMLPFLNHVWAFDHATVTDEDRSRTRMYRENVEREKARRQTVSFESFIKALDLRVTLEEATADQLDRVSQLTFRTNQFNFTTIRRSVPELRDFLGRPNAHCLVVRVADRFGDHGLSGVVLYEATADCYDVETLLLSCRVLGKGVEHAVVAGLAGRAAKDARPFVELTYRPTQRNAPAWQFIESIANLSDISGSGGRRIGDAVSWTFRADDLARLEFHAERGGPRADEAGPALPSNGSAHANPCEPVQRAAEDLRGIDRIVIAIDEYRRRRRPPSRPFPSVPRGTTAPEALDAVELALAGIWEDLLNVAPVGRHDDFFALGGHSLMAIRLLSRIERRFHTTLGVSAVFDSPTLGALSARVKERLGTGAHGPVLGPVSREVFRTSLADLSGEREE